MVQGVEGWVDAEEGGWRDSAHSDETVIDIIETRTAVISLRKVVVLTASLTRILGLG